VLTVTFWGVRGSTPCPEEGKRRFGGNTSCVALESPGSDPIVLDLGTGLRAYGETQPSDGSFRGHALVTHLHFDHVQGLPFFACADRPGARFDLYAPVQPDGPALRDVFTDFIRPPYFPVCCTELRGDYRFHGVADTDLVVGDAKVTVRTVPHVGDTNGYRIELGGASVAYVSDHQQPIDADGDVPAGVLELADGVDLLIHDAQYTSAEFAEKSHWGHCTVEYAVEVARRAGARRLALFHHDPGHDDDAVDAVVADARAAAAGSGIEVLAAAEGLTVVLADTPPDPWLDDAA
jgi:phosphoribosyl 1,2-cyclic phosphodiesterase